MVYDFGSTSLPFIWLVSFEACRVLRFNVEVTGASRIHITGRFVDPRRISIYPPGISMEVPLCTMSSWDFPVHKNHPAIGLPPWPWKPPFSPITNQVITKY